MAKKDSSSGRDLEKQRKALNNSRIVLHAKALAQMGDNWDVGKNVTVSFAPFLHDPVKSGEIVRASNDLRDVPESGNGAAGAQNHHLTKEALIDIVATRKDAPVLCVGIEGLGSQCSNWVFAAPCSPGKDFLAISRNLSNEKDDDLLRVPIDGKGPCSIRMEECRLHPKPTIYEQGMSFQRDAKCGYVSNNSLAEASRRITEGTFGLVVESLTPSVSASGDKNVQRFIPIIVTTAAILSCEYDQDDLAANGESNMNFVEKNAVIYDCPIPASARFPNQMADVNKHAYENTKRHVLIVNPKGLKDLLGDICPSRT